MVLKVMYIRFYLPRILLGSTFSSRVCTSRGISRGKILSARKTYERKRADIIVFAVAIDILHHDEIRDVELALVDELRMQLWKDSPERNRRKEYI